MEKIKLGIVVSEYNYDITMMMLERAKAHAEFLGVKVEREIKVPGVFEIPLAVKTILNDVDAAVALGCVIEGETKHDEIIMHNAARKLEDIMLDTGKPIGLGISGHGQSRLQAEARIEKAKEAVESAVKMIKLMKQNEN